MTNFKAAIFDMDGLLLDSEQLALQAFEAGCAQFGLGDQTDLFMRFVGTNAEKGNAEMKLALDDEVDVDAFIKTWRGMYAEWIAKEAVPLKTGVKDVLTHLNSLNIPIAVATSTRTEPAEKKLKMAGIFDHFDVVVGGDQVAHSKPNPDIFLKAAEILACDPSSCIAFEDSPNGVRSAVAAGMTVVQIPDMIEPDATLLELGHIVLDEISDVLKFDFEKHLNPAA
ncbi:MAG: HAD family phosphatase [Psychrosphaera sp.]|nr:HAD family phosphatase [Psychrosphaera sp.]